MLDDVVIMIKVIDKVSNLKQYFPLNSFSMVEWKKYICDLVDSEDNIFIKDMNETINTGKYSFENDFFPVLNNALSKENEINDWAKTFQELTLDLDDKLCNDFGKSVDATIVLYLGLCNGAGWATSLNNNQYILLGVEKILELGWTSKDYLMGLIYHELGHIYQNQYGILTKDFNNNYDRFLWQLFTEGIAMYFEQVLCNDINFYNRSKEWLQWCDNHLNEIKKDFWEDLAVINPTNQSYFGDWVRYKGHSDVGYYLGAKFIHYIMKDNEFDDVLSWNIEEVKKAYQEFLKN